MRYEEEQFAAAVEELRAFSETMADNNVRADLAVIIDGFQTMRPYVSVGLRVCASDETLEAIERLQRSGVLTQELCNALTKAMKLARTPNQAALVQEAPRKPCRRAAPRHLRSSLPLGANRVKRFA